jgi:hypothetical protein
VRLDSGTANEVSELKGNEHPKLPYLRTVSGREASRMLKKELEAVVRPVKARSKRERKRESYVQRKVNIDWRTEVSTDIGIWVTRGDVSAKA